MEQCLQIFTILQLALPNSSSPTAVSNDDAESSSGSDESGGNEDEASGSLPNVDFSTESGHEVLDVDIRYDMSPGPPDLHTDLPLAISPNFSLENMHPQDDLQREAVTIPSHPPGQQGGPPSPNEIERLVTILHYTTFNTPSNLPECSQQYDKPANHTISNVPKCSDQLFTNIGYSPLKLSQELVHHQRPLLPHVHDYSVPDQDQQPSNHYNLQSTVRGAQSELLEDDEHHPKTQKKEKEQTVTSMPIKDEKGEHAEKRVKFSEDVKLDKADDSFKDLKEFIKQYVKQEIGSKRSNIKRLCDAVIVYDKNDYDYAVDMKDEIKAMVTQELNEKLRIELFDDEKFMQSHVQVVQDVLKNANVVLVYLSNNTENSRQVQFFIEEAVAVTRIGPIHKGGLVSDCEFSVRPVHSQPPNRRNYRIPPGLVSVSGIDWYDKSKHTYDRIVAIMKNAIRRRKLIENPRQVQEDFRQTSLRTGSSTHQQFHRRHAPQQAWVAGTSAYTTSVPRYTPQDTTERLYKGINDPTQHGFNISDAERRMSIEPNQGSAASSYTKGGDHFLRTGETYSQPEFCYVYANVNTSFTPYSEPVAPFGVQQNISRPTRAMGLELGHQPAEEPEFHGYHRIGQFSRIGEQSHFLRHNQMPLNEEPQYRRDGGDEKHVMGLVNDGQTTNTSRTNNRSADGYDATNQPHPRHSAMQQAPGARRQRATEYTPRQMQQQTQQQQQPRGQMDNGRGIITSEMLISNLSTNDVEIDNPTSIQESRRMYDQGPADNVYTEDSDSSEDELWDPLGNLPGSKGGRVVNIVGSQVLQIVMWTRQNII
ncbi:uncharacterized protein LOC127877595 isoform X2 [Dreissena polymorpha]|uniref:uncharacterized protein LOC127877595 isoform X2 n=1 Tax=Dreissena polymorpha TaxID=45954 RepID=UPI00226467E5|nr:uncharacterized protein LOC127877595 isoform X2 [Dreissena polymorpha]